MAPAIIIFSYASASRTKPIDKRAGVAQLVELQPSKLDVASSNLVSRSKRCLVRKLSKTRVFEGDIRLSAHVAQSVERFLGKEEVQRFDSVRGLHNLSADPAVIDGNS